MAQALSEGGAGVKVGEGVGPHAVSNDGASLLLTRRDFLTLAFLALLPDTAQAH